MQPSRDLQQWNEEKERRDYVRHLWSLGWGQDIASICSQSYENCCSDDTFPYENISGHCMFNCIGWSKSRVLKRWKFFHYYLFCWDFPTLMAKSKLIEWRWKDKYTGDWTGYETLNFPGVICLMIVTHNIRLYSTCFMNTMFYRQYIYVVNWVKC